MKYKEILELIREKKIASIQPFIASEVDYQLEKEISDEEFEEICSKVFFEYCDSFDEPDIWQLIDEELTRRGFKGDNTFSTTEESDYFLL